MLPIDGERTLTADAPPVVPATPILEDTLISTTKIHEYTSSQVVADSAMVSASSRPVEELDAQSPLEGTDFLSFEEWKRRNLLKAGQSEHIGRAHQDDVNGLRKRSADLSNSLDSLGDDADIDLDFNGFVADRPDLAFPPHPLKHTQAGPVLSFDQETVPAKAKSRSRQAGTTSKQRTNYASFDCAATVLSANKQAKGSNSVLIENKDSYMLNECSAENKFLILELCNDISIDTIVLANFEFFSSTFRTFQVSVSDKYPVKAEKWKVLGIFEARNIRDVQPFLIENPMIWARYLRIEFIAHYGSEHYCPLSLVRVHGTTMMEEYKYDIESSMTDDDEDENNEYAEEVVVVESRLEALAEIDLSTEDAPKAFSETVEPTESMSNEASFKGSIDKSTYLKASYRVVGEDTCPAHPLRNPPEFSSPTNLPQRTCAITDARVRSQSPSGPKSDEPFGIFVVPTLGEQLRETPRIDPSIPLTTASSRFSSLSPSKAVSAESASDTALSVAPTANKTATKAIDSTSIDKSKSNATSTQSAPANPTIQESFFKSVQKRLQMLESNSSLSLQYIEEQSRALRDAFGKVEQRQIARTTTFLEYLNVTVLNELRDFRQQYDQLWQSTVIELEMQREQYQRETFTINARLGVLADEVIFQKRMAILQMFLIFICLGLILFSRGSMQNYMDFPAVQSMLSRSPSAKRMTLSALGTPSRSPPTTRPSSSHRMKPPSRTRKGHQRGLSGDSIDSTRNDDLYLPPTNISHDALLDLVDVALEPVKHADPQFNPTPLERPSTSPPMLSNSGDQLVPGFGVLLDSGNVDESLPDSSGVDTVDQRVSEIDVDKVLPKSKRLGWELTPS